MKISVLGDLHLSEQSPRYAHALEVLDHCIDVGVQRNAKIWVFCGDVFEGKPTPGEYHAFLQRVYRIIEHGGMVCVVRGNHEAYEAYSFFELLNPMIRVAWDAFLWQEFDACRVLLMPYPVRYRPPFHAVYQETISGSMRASVNLIADKIREVAALDAKSLFVFGHFSIEGLTTRDTDFERHSPNEVVVPLEAFEPTALTRVGHIHRAQQLTDKTGSVGSLYRTSFAEIDDPKIFCLITVADDGTITTEDIPTGCRGMREFALELDDLTSTTLREIEDVAAQGIEIKVVLSMASTEVSRYDPTVFDKVKATAPLFVLEKNVRPVQRVRAPALQPNMNLTEEFFAWTQAIGTEIAAERMPSIGEKLRELE